ncbi:signal peptidase II [Dactylosporangium darangshiense]|uniref:Lipoprotein signal peptidase n=1 Tax=Dactylosporangium darangshiense TaxID=579108 RepID=A0ABP8DEM3_9ACTN
MRQRHPRRATRRFPVRYALRHLQAVGGAALTTQDPTQDRTEPGTRPRTRAWAVFGLVAAAIVAIDLAVKQWTTSTIANGEPVKLFGGLIYVIYTRNSGAAFSMLRDQTWIFPLVALGVICWLFWMIKGTVSTAWAIALGLVLGGAAGNLGDRLFRAPGPFQGHVVDMFSFLDDHAGHFPVFNIADSALTVGVILAILLEFTGRRRDGSRVKRDA